MSNKKFYETQTPSSKIKASIVAKYFPQYCRIINRSRQKEFRFLDLFAGKGIYDDGSFSTPLLLGKAIAKDKELSQLVRFIFNDKKKEFINALEHNFKQHIRLVLL